MIRIDGQSSLQDSRKACKGLPEIQEHRGYQVFDGWVSESSLVTGATGFLSRPASFALSRTRSSVGLCHSTQERSPRFRARVWIIGQAVGEHVHVRFAEAIFWWSLFREPPRMWGADHGGMYRISQPRCQGDLPPLGDSTNTRSPSLTPKLRAASGWISNSGSGMRRRRDGICLPSEWK